MGFVQQFEGNSTLTVCSNTEWVISQKILEAPNKWQKQREIVLFRLLL